MSNKRAFLNSEHSNDIRDKLEKQNEFLKNLIQYVRITTAAKKTGVSVYQVQEWRKEDIMFRERFDSAQALSYEMIEDEAIRRAYVGVKTPIIKDGEVVGYRKVYSDALMALILKAKLPSYKDSDPKKIDGMSTLLILPANGREFKELPPEDERFELPRDNELKPIEELVNKAKEEGGGIFQKDTDDEDFVIE